MNTQNTNSNPLFFSDDAIPFDLIEARHVEPAVDQLIKDAQAALTAISAATGTRTYENTLGALEDATTHLEESVGIVSHLEGLLDDADLRDAYNAIQPKIASFYSSIPLNLRLYEALKAFAETEEAQSLDAVRRRLLDRTLVYFKRHGAELSEEDKKTLSAIDVELAQTTNRFGQNVTDATDAYSLLITDEERLTGIPAGTKDGVKTDEGWRFNLQAPTFIAVMTYAEDAELRRELYSAYNSRASRGQYNNCDGIAQILDLRQRKAQLLGYNDVADLYLEDRMAGSGAVAYEFVNDLRSKSEAAAVNEHRALETFRQTMGEASSLAPWDLAFYAEKQRQAHFDFDEEELRPYFGLDSVLDGLYELLNRLYGIQIERVEDLPTWHDDVQSYRISEADGTVCGVFYLDLFPRKGKRGGAWMMPMRTGAPQDGVPHVGAVCCNFTPPADGKPALLRHREVETTFHEFGHLMHHLLTTVTVRSLAGTNVPWDFVELPSQIMENWCWERESLNLFARHYESGESIPPVMLEKMRAARTFRAGTAMMRQLSFAAVDLRLHREYSPQENGEVVSYAREIAQGFSAVDLPSDYSMITSFQHLFAGPVAYASGYYSYKWAEVLDADAFSRFAKEGLFSREVGDAFRQTLLSKGNSQDPMELFVDFVGRKPDPNALLERAGLM